MLSKSNPKVCWKKQKNILLVITITLVFIIGVILFYQQKKISQVMDFLGLAQSPSDILGPSPENQVAVQESAKAREDEFRKILPKTLSELKEAKVVEGVLKNSEKGKLKVEATIVDIGKVKNDADIASAPLVKKEFEILLVKGTFIAGGKTSDKMKIGDSVRVVTKEAIYRNTKGPLIAEAVFSPAEDF